MSKRELWEIVRADELQPDDVIRLDIYSHAIHVDRLIFGGGLVQIYPSKDSLSHRQPVLRRIPDADNPIETREVWLVIRYGTVLARKWSEAEAYEFPTLLATGRDGITIERVVERVMDFKRWQDI